MSLETRVLKECLARVEADPAGAMSYFYGRLFARDPHLRALFPAAMDAQHDRFFQALTRLVWSQDNPAGLGEHLGRLGRDHRRYGVRPEHYPAVEAALLATLRSFAADVWDAPTEDAWTTAFRSAARAMTAAAERDASAHPPWWVAEIVAHDRRAHDLAVLTLRPGRTLPYLPGQHVSVQTARWPRVWRPYSIANAPRPDGTLSLHVRAQPGGWVSGALVRHSRPGDTLLLGPAAGAMTLDPASARGLLLIGAGTGLAPMKALAEQAAANGRETCLLVGARTADDLYDLPDLRRLEGASETLRVVPVLSRSPERTGGLLGALPGLLDGIRGWQERDAYVAGPVPLVQQTVSALQRYGMSLNRVHHDLLAAGAEDHHPARSRRNAVVASSAG